MTTSQGVDTAGLCRLVELVSSPFFVLYNLLIVIDYTIKVISHSTLLQTLSFSTYGPNNMNKPLQSLWKRTPDDIYLQPSWDHKTYAFESLGESALWYKHFKQPVVAVFDVVMQDSGNSLNPKPVVLLQPRPKLQELFPTRAARLDGIRDRTFINRIGDSLFAMGHINYPLVNLAPPPHRIGSTPDTEGLRCIGIECFLGVRYTDREGAKSRISRLIDAGPANRSAGDRILPRDDSGATPNNLLPTAPEIAAIPLPSRSDTLGPDGNFIGLQSQEDNIRPKAPGAPFWTLALPFIGGFIAIWLLLRKFTKTSSNQQDRLIQPLQTSGSSADVTTALLSPRSHSRHPSASGVAYATYAGATTYTAVGLDSPPVTQRDDSREFNEKTDSPFVRDDEEANLSLSLEEARVGAGLGMPVEAKDAEDSEGEDGDGDPQDAKKKTRRGGRGRKKKNKQKNPASATEPPPPPEANSGRDSGSNSSDYVMIDKQPGVDRPSAKMELPLPVTSSSSSLVVTSKVLGEYLISPSNESHF